MHGVETAAGRRHAPVGIAATVAAMASAHAGAAIAKHLFPIVGSVGMAGLRTSLAAILLLLLIRPWQRGIPRQQLPAVIGYGIALGFMNLLIYQAFERIPVGIASGIEVFGPLVVVVLTSRGWTDIAWFLMAVVGVVLLFPHGDSDLDVFGIAFALGAGVAWAGYILIGSRLAPTMGADAVAWGMVVASLITMPLAMTASGERLLDLKVLGVGLCVAVMSSALPFTLEMFAMRRLPSNVFGMIQGTNPAIAAMMGFLVLGETLTRIQALAILLIVIALCGCLSSARRRSV